MTCRCTTGNFTVCVCARARRTCKDNCSCVEAGNCQSERFEDPYNEMDPALNATLNAIIHAIQQQQIESGRMQDVLADVVNRVTAPAPVNAVRLPEMLEKAVVFDGKREEDFQEWFEAINRVVTNAGWTVDQKKRVAIGSLLGVLNGRTKLE